MSKKALNSVRTQLKLGEPLSVLEQIWLVGRLVASNGVRGATYSEEDSRQLTVEYDPSRMNSIELMNVIYLCGLDAEPMAARTLYHDPSRRRVATHEQPDTGDSFIADDGGLGRRAVEHQVQQRKDGRRRKVDGVQ